MATVTVRDLRKVFDRSGRLLVALDRVSFEAGGHSFVSIVGPSGCGKSTLLNILAGIERPTDGEAAVTNNGGRARIGYVFQSPRLLPWRSVTDNMLFVHRDRGPATREQILHNLEMVGLADARDAYPGQLSGGMQQRVGIARAFSIEPDALLMDEPFSHLDAITARGLRRELHTIWNETKKLVLFVTHDVGEAVELSSRVVMLAKGGTLRRDMEIDLPFPRNPADDRVALMKAEVLRQFEELDVVAS